MGKFLLSIMCALTAVLTGYAQDAAYSIPTNGNTTYWPGKSAYTGNEEFTSKDGKWVACNFNTNNINPIRCGSKSAAAIAYIRTANALEEAISQVKLTFGKYTTNSVNSLKLYISDTNTFDGEGISPANTPSLSDGCIFDIPTPSANKYYKIVFDMKKGANGDVQLKSGEFFVQTDPNKCATPIAMINGEPVANGGKAVVGDELSLTCNTEDATITYTITGANFTGESQTYDSSPIKLDEIGVYTITAKATKDGMDASDVLKINDLDVVGKTPQMSFANASVYGKVNTGVVWQQVTVVEPTENAGAISYSSSDPEIVTVDATTGRIRPEDVKKAGVATITAIMASKGDYAEGTASYLIVVIDPNAQIQPDHTVFDFTTEDPYGMTTQNGGSAYEQNIKSIPGENETVTLSFTGNYRSYNSSSAPYHLRLQKGAKLTITVPEGYKITKIGITGSNIKGTYDPASGTNADLTDPDGGTFSYVWIPQEAAGAVRSITYTSPSGSSADPTQIKKINVMWDAADSELKPVQLTFTPNVNGIYVNEEALINAVNNPKGRVITYSIPALDPEPGTETSESENQPKKYSIEEIDGKLKVRVTEPGSYTLEARSAAGDGFRDGFAIMRLNVYRHLAVYANEVALDEDVINTTSGNTDVTIDVPENANLYYRLENTTTPETVAENESDDENMLEGYTLYEDGITVPAKTAGTLNFYIANYGYLSPIRKITLSFETGIGEIENAANGAVRTFDLNGREIKGTPEKGVYIRIQNGKATKVLVK